MVIIMNNELNSERKIEKVELSKDNDSDKLEALEVSDFEIEVEEMLGDLEEEKNNSLKN